MEEQIQQEFFDSIKAGTGRAFVLMKKHPDIDFSKWIIKGAVKNYAYDWQCEGSRADYIYRLIKKSKQKNKIIKEILRKLKVKKTDYKGLDQMCDLAVLFYESGITEAKSVIYERYCKNDFYEFEYCGEYQIAELYGLEGILKIAEVEGKHLLDNPEEHDIGWCLENFQKENKSIDVYDELKKAGKSNKYIASYYNSAIENRSDSISSSKRGRRRQKRYSYEQAREGVYNKRYFLPPKNAVKSLTSQEVEKLARDLLCEKDKIFKAKYLLFFGHVKFPLGYKPLLKLATGSNPRGTRTVQRAFEALKFFKDQDLRHFALEKIFSAKNPSNYLYLLVSNYEAGDYKLINEIIDRSDDYDYIHSLVWAITDIYKVNQVAESKEPLEKMYRKMNCGLHREDIVQLLFDNGVLSEEILEELPYDSYELNLPVYQEIRKQYKARYSI